ncbi:hypothetical protein AX15_006067 [Amanita polypyramis BW_CC]|nr:hypothetical protein AX15_006067 [Amanita polypyramis BW_CC]
MGDTTVVFLFTICTLCIIFLIWRKSDSLKRVMSHQLKTLSEPEGRIRLSEDDGPPARSFIEDDLEEEDVSLRPADGAATATASTRQ